MEDNGKLYTIVMEKFKFEPRLDESGITVAIKGKADVVVLGGVVKTYAEKLIAENLVKAIPGVRVVVEEIAVDYSPLYQRSDVDIAVAANNVLRWNVMVPTDRIKAVVDSGCVTLSGDVEWKHQKQSAYDAIIKLWGVRMVVNNIKIVPGMNITVSTVQKRIVEEFARNARINASKIKIEVDGNKIILKGSVHNLDEVDEALDAAWSIPGVAEVRDELEIG